MRLVGKTAIVIGAGQSPGEGMGNGRATVLRFAQEGAKIMAVDRDLGSAEETEANMHAALRLHVEGMIEDAEPIPASTALAEYMVVA